MRAREAFGWLLIMFACCWLTAFLMLEGQVGPAMGTVKLAWDASPSSGVTGYSVYYGSVTGVYSNHFDAGLVLVVTVSNLVMGNVYYFAVTAKAGGVESPFSNEIAYRVPGLVSAPDLRLER